MKFFLDITSRGNTKRTEQSIRLSRQRGLQLMLGVSHERLVLIFSKEFVVFLATAISEQVKPNRWKRWVAYQLRHLVAKVKSGLWSNLFDIFYLC